MEIKMTAEEIINDIFTTSEKCNELLKEKFEKTKKYTNMLNDMYGKYIGQYINFHDYSNKGGFFGGFENAYLSDYWCVIPIVYYVNKNGKPSKRKYMTFERDTKTVINLLNK